MVSQTDRCSASGGARCRAYTEVNSGAPAKRPSGMAVSLYPQVNWLEGIMETEPRASRCVCHMCGQQQQRRRHFTYKDVRLGLLPRKLSGSRSRLSMRFMVLQAKRHCAGEVQVLDGLLAACKRRTISRCRRSRKQETAADRRRVERSARCEREQTHRPTTTPCVITRCDVCGASNPTLPRNPAPSPHDEQRGDVV